MLLSFPVGTGVRVDANRRAGDTVDIDDPLIAVFTAWGPDRTVALERVRRALERSAVVIDGGVTNRTLLLSVLGHGDFAAGARRRRLARAAGRRSTSTRPESDCACSQLRRRPTKRTGVTLRRRSTARPNEAAHSSRSRSVRASSSATRGRPTGSTSTGSARAATPFAAVRTLRTSPSTNSTPSNDESHCGGRRHRLVIIPTGDRVSESSWMLTTHRVEREDGVALRAGWPALVVSRARPGRVTRSPPVTRWPSWNR